MFILALIIYVILLFSMMATVVCLESDCKKIIFWNLTIVLTSIVGFAVYFTWFCDKPKLKNSIKTKFEQDVIYKDLVKCTTGNQISDNETINFNNRHYSAEILNHNSIQVIDNEDAFVKDLLRELEKAKKYIIIDTEYFLMHINNYNIISVLKDKQNVGVIVKCIYDKNRFRDKKTISELRESGIRVCKFNKYDTFNKYYKNTKNLISIDGNNVYIYNTYKYNNDEKPVSCSNLYYKLQGEIVKSVDLDCHLDVSFATQKYFELTNKEYQAKGEIQMQYVSSVADKDFEGLLLKAINDAKKQIIIHINKFIPTPAIKQALAMAIMSGVDVKIMLSKGSSMNYYASRAYLKEMAMVGATAYIYDGIIGSNFVIIDDLTFVGNFSLVNLEIRHNLQNILIINNEDFSHKTQLYFSELVNNSYRICKPKNVLFREKIFKKFN